MSMTRPDTNGHFQSHYIPNTTDEQAEMLAKHMSGLFQTGEVNDEKPRPSGKREAALSHF